MNLVKTLEQYNNNNIFFCEPTKNNIVNDGIFIKILYSAKSIVFNGIFLKIKFNILNYENYYNKYKINFDTKVNKELINNLKKLEEELLLKYSTNKIPHFKLNNQLNNGFIKIFNNTNNITTNTTNNITTNTTNTTNNTTDNITELIIKISGIWENETNYGLTYKFIYPSTNQITNK